MNKEDSIKKLEFEKKFEDESGYRSPIELIYSDLQMKLEDNVCEAVQSVGVNVDKDELIKALQYDRDQYAKGFADGYAQGIEVGKNIVIEELKRCIENGFERSIDVKFMVGEVDYDADECCASCRYLCRDKGKWKCVLNNLERDIADPARRHCLGYEDVRKGKEEPKHLCTERSCASCLNLQMDGYCGLGYDTFVKYSGVCERWESK